jgi:type IV pilus assembly protein PilB
MNRKPIGELLVAEKKIDAWQLASALAYQQKWGGRIGQALVALNFITEPELYTSLGKQLGVPYVHIGDRFVPPAVLSLVPAKLLRARRALPLSLCSESRRGPLLVALAEPQNLAHLDELAFASSMSVKPVLAAESDLERALNRHLSAARPPPVPRRESIELPLDEDRRIEPWPVARGDVDFGRRRFN